MAKKREMLFRAGEPIDAFFKIRSGIVAAAVAEALSAAQRQAAEDMLVLGQLKATERVAHFLAAIGALYQQRHVSSQPLSLKIGRSEIADYLGLSIETVSRSFTKLKDHHIIGLMGRDKDEVVVLDDDRLRQIGKVGQHMQSNGHGFLKSRNGREGTAMEKKKSLWTSKYWRDRAEEARTKAAEMKDADAKATMERVAEEYQLLGSAPNFELSRPVCHTAV